MLTEDAHPMPTGDFPGSPLQSATRLLGPRPADRIAARLRRAELDRALTDGADPAGSPLIAARAAQLSSACTRTRIAAALERLALSADRPRSRVRTLPWRVAMLANRSELLELATTLRRDRPVYARGLAMLELIVTDGAGPAYTDRCGEALGRQLRIARARLSG